MTAAAAPPLINLALVGVDASELVVDVAMNRQAFAFLPTANRGDVALQVRGYLFPGVEKIAGRCVTSIRPIRRVPNHSHSQPAKDGPNSTVIVWFLQSKVFAGKAACRRFASVCRLRQNRGRARVSATLLMSPSSRRLVPPKEANVVNEINDFEHQVRTIVAVVAIALSVTVTPQSPTAADLCATTLVADLKLEEDLNCPGDGLIVGADGVTVDLNGRTIAGSGIGNGITVRGRRGVVIAGGTIRGFVTGVFVGGSSGIVIKDNRFTQNREAVFLNGSNANTVRENVAWQNQLRGIMIRPSLTGVQSTHNVVTENILIDNPSGILVFGQPENTLKENIVTGSTVAGIDLAGPGAPGNLIKENTLTSSAAGI